MMLAGCGLPSQVTIAVNNDDPTPYVLRIGPGDGAWLVPPNDRGIGPTFPSEPRSFVIVSTPDCKEVGRFAMDAGSYTLFVEGGSMGNPDVVTGPFPSLPALERIPDPCSR